MRIKFFVIFICFMVLINGCKDKDNIQSQQLITELKLKAVDNSNLLPIDYILKQCYPYNVGKLSNEVWNGFNIKQNSTCILNGNLYPHYYNKKVEFFNPYITNNQYILDMSGNKIANVSISYIGGKINHGLNDGILNVTLTNGYINLNMICSKYSVNILYSNIKNYPLTEIPTKYNYYINKCFLINRTLKYDTVFEVETKAYYPTNDYVEFVLIDFDYVDGVYKVEDVGLEDIKYIVK